MMIKTLEQRKAEALKALNTFHGTTSVVSHGINKGSFNTVLLTNEQREKLLPDNCPLCDKKVEVKFNEGCVYTDFHGFERHSKDTYVIECRNKHSVRVTNTDKLEAIKSWNTRHNPHAEIAEELAKYTTDFLDSLIESGFGSTSDKALPAEYDIYVICSKNTTG